MRPLFLGLLAFALLGASIGRARADFIYSTAGDGTGLVKIDQTTGSATVIGPSGSTGSYAAAFAPSGILYGIENYGTANNRLVTYNLGTGAATAATTSTFGVSDLSALEINRAGTIYGGSFSGGFYVINPTTGVATLIGFGSVIYLLDLAFDANGVLWGATRADLYQIDPATGAATHIVRMTGSGSSDVGGIMFDSNNVLYATTFVAGSSLYTINTTNGALTLVGNTGQSSHYGGAFPQFSNPEPSSLTLVGIGAACAAVAGWRRRRRGNTSAAPPSPTSA